MPDSQKNVLLRKFSVASHRETMASMVPLCVVLVCTTTASALHINPLQPTRPPEPDPVSRLSNITTQERTNRSHISLPRVELLDHAYNTSLSILNLSTEPTFNCDEELGRDLSVQMCGGALASIPSAIGQASWPFSFGPRETNTFDIGLPRRFMSGELLFLRFSDFDTYQVLISEQLMASARSSCSSCRERHLPSCRR